MSKQEDNLDNKIRGLRKPDEKTAKFLISAELEDIRGLISQERAKAVIESYNRGYNSGYNQSRQAREPKRNITELIKLIQGYAAIIRINSEILERYPDIEASLTVLENSLLSTKRPKPKSKTKKK